jgi:hypothetical protein
MMTIIRRLRGFTLAAAMLAIASPALAQEWSGMMGGTNEVPPNASAATGSALLSLTGNVLTVNVFWSALVGGPPMAAHIHCCVTPGNNVGVAVNFPGFPATTSGTYSNTFDLLNSAVYTSSFLTNFGGGTAAGAMAALIAGLNDDKAYVNIHNSTVPGGEIRANVTSVVPEPASLGLMATGLIAIAVLRRKRRPRVAPR